MSANKTDSKKDKPIAGSENQPIRLTPEQVVENAQADNARFEYTQRQLVELQRIANEMAGALAALTEIGKTPAGENILVPLGAGIFIEAQLADTKTVKTGLSGTVMVNRSLDDARQKISENMSAVQKDIERLSLERDRLAANLQTWQKMISDYNAAKTPLAQR